MKLAALIYLVWVPMWAQNTQDSLVQMLSETRMTRAEVLSMHSDLIALRSIQEQHGAQIALNTGRISDLKYTVDHSELGILSAHVAALDNEIKNHEKEDQDAKAAAVRDHESYMRALEIGLGFVTCGLGILGAMVGMSNRRHGKQLAEMRGEARSAYSAANNYSEREKRMIAVLENVSGRMGTEEARSDATDLGQGVQDGRLDDLEK